MSHVIILASTVAEGNAYVREHRDELPRGRSIIPVSASQIMGVVPSKVIELPDFSKRRDRHALVAAIKRATRRYQGVEWVKVGEEDPRGPLTDRQIEVAYRYNDLRDTSNGSNMESEGAPVVEPKPRQPRKPRASLPEKFFED